METTILAGIALSLVTQVIKWLTVKFGKELTTAVVYIFLFLVAVVWVYLTQRSLFTVTDGSDIIALMSVSIATYELVLKRALPFLQDSILSPVAKKLGMIK